MYWLINSYTDPEAGKELKATVYVTCQPSDTSECALGLKDIFSCEYATV